MRYTWTDWKEPGEFDERQKKSLIVLQASAARRRGNHCSQSGYSTDRLDVDIRDLSPWIGQRRWCRGASMSVIVYVMRVQCSGCIVVGIEMLHGASLCMHTLVLTYIYL